METGGGANRLLGIFCYRDVLFRNKLCDKQFLHSRKVFSEAREYMNRLIAEDGGRSRDSKAADMDGQCFPVCDDDGQLLYVLEYMYAGKFQPMIRRFSWLEYEEYEIGNRHLLDLELLDRADWYIFEEFNEYTYAISEVIRRHLTGREVFFRDKKALYFYTQGEVYVDGKLSGNWVDVMMDGGQKRVMWIQGDFREIALEDLFLNSFPYLNLFDSVFYMQQSERKLYGKPDRLNVTGINSNRGNTGILYSMTGIERYSFRRHMHITYSGEFSCICPNAFYEKHFLFSLGQQLCQDINENLLEMKLIRLNAVPQILLMQKNIGNYFTKEYIEVLKRETARILPQDTRVLGVLCRGTDYTVSKPRGHSRQAEPEKVISRARKMMLQDNYECLFLATESADILEQFLEAFGNLLHYVEQERYYDSQFDQTTRVIGQVIRDENVQKKEKRAEDYMKAIYILSNCTSLLASGNCGAIRMALDLNKDQYEEVYIYELGVY